MSKMKISVRWLVVAGAILAIVGGARVLGSDNGAGAMAAGRGMVFSGANTKLCKVGQELDSSADGEKKGVGASKLVIACAEAQFFGLLRTVAYRKKRSETCVEVEAVRQKEVHEALCTPDKQSWTESWCGGAEGCIIGVPRGPGYSEFAGLLPPQAAAVRITVGGKVKEGAISIGQVTGKLLQPLHTRNRFSMFAAVFHGCIPPRAIQVEAFDSKRNSLGEAAPWLGPEVGC